MRFNLPILTSDMDFARCVCGDAALFFDPRDVDDICAAIARLKNSGDLQQQLSSAGRKRHQDHSLTWDEIALSVIRTLELLARRGGAMTRQAHTGECDVCS
jgi:glycosyltransferase involved in cell wall biosynthesis